MDNQNQSKKNGRSKAPAFQFYAMDWLTDPSLRLCDPETRGIWMDLLCYMFLSSRPGYLMINGIILDEKMIQKYVGLDAKRFKRIWHELTSYDIIKKDSNGCYYSKRMIDDERIREIRRQSGILGGNPKLKKKDNQKDNQKDKQTNKQKQTPSSSSSSSNNINDINIINNDDHELIKWIKSNCPNVSTLRDQLTNDQAIELISEFQQNEIMDIISSMENYKKLKSQYVSVFLTCKNWLKRKKDESRNHKGTGKPSFQDAIRNW